MNARNSSGAGTSTAASRRSRASSPTRAAGGRQPAAASPSPQVAVDEVVDDPALLRDAELAAAVARLVGLVLEPVAERVEVQHRVRVGEDEAREREHAGQREAAHAGAGRGAPGAAATPARAGGGATAAAPSRQASTIPAVYLVAQATPSAAPASAYSRARPVR